MSNSENELRDDVNYHHEHRVMALVPRSDGTVARMYTDWTPDRDMARMTAEALRNADRQAEIQSRPLTSTVELEEVPE